MPVGKNTGKFFPTLGKTRWIFQVGSVFILSHTAVREGNSKVVRLFNSSASGLWTAKKGS